MKKLYIFSFLLILSVSNVFSQSGWFWQNPLPQGNDLNCIKFNDENTGFAVGYKGTIIKTMDGGNNWIILNSQTIEILYNVLFINESIGFVIGEKGTILRTSNGGLNWETEFSLSNSKFNGIYFQNLLTGWVCGYDNNNMHGIIYKTTNSGITWNLNFTSPYDERFYRLNFINSNYGFIGSGTSLFKTTNGGVNWLIVNYLSGSIDFEMVDSLNIFFVGGYTIGSTSHGTINKTTNGGSNITSQLNLLDTVLFSVDFINSSTGFVCGQKGKILKTTNYGNNWDRLVSNSVSKLNYITFVDSIFGWIAGEKGTLINTTNSGTNWNLNTKGFPYINLLSCKFLNASTGFVSGQSSILKTTNGGENWVNTLGVNNNVWNNLYMINDSLGYALSNYRQFYQTTNSGNNWNYITEVEPEFTINTMLFINSNTGFLIGKKSFGGPTYTTTGYVFKTTNSGLNWNGTLMGSENTCGISFVNDNTGYLSGARSMMYKTTNCGINWVYFRYNFNTNITFYSINFVNENTGWIIYNDDAFSSNGSGIYKTTNGGIDLEEQFHFPNERLGSLCVYDSNNIWITSQKARVYATSNGGVNWYYQFTPNNTTLNSIYFVTPSIGWGVGENGTIIKTNSGIGISGILPITAQIPQSYSLNQNYPNPFNPVTKIKFALPKQSFAKIVIYDLLGREVATLVNENLKPGSYEVDWDGSAFASGVYFYSLIVDDPSTGSGLGFVETKRMVLLK